jgi:hypothetical protein
MERAFVGLIFGTRSAPAASTPLPSRAPTTSNDRQRTGDDEKESRWWTKKLEDRSGRSTMAVGCGKSKWWRA